MTSRLCSAATASLPPPHIESPEQKFKETELKCFRIHADYRHLLEQWKMDFTSDSPECEWHPCFIKALQNLTHVEYFLDILIDGEIQEQVALIMDYGKEMRTLERRMAELAATDAASRETYNGGDAAAYNILTERTGLVKPIGDDCHCQCKEYSRNQVFFKPPDGGLQDSLEIYPEDRPRKCGFGGTSKALDFLPEDTKAGMIQAYLDRSIDDTACSKQIYKEALNHVINEPKQWEIREINEIMNQCITGWKYFSNQRIFTEYDRQRLPFRSLETRCRTTHQYLRSRQKGQREGLECSLTKSEEHRTGCHPLKPADKRNHRL